MKNNLYELRRSMSRTGSTRDRSGLRLIVLGLIPMCAQIAAAANNHDADAGGGIDQVDRYRLLMSDVSDRSWSDGLESSLKLSAQIQTRYIFNDRSNAVGGDVTNGFEARRTKLKATGRLDDPRFRYTIAMAFSRSTGAMTTEEVYTRWKIDDDWTLKFGQFRPTVMREQTISSKYQLGVERSLLSAAFGQSYNRGVALRYNAGNFRVTGSVMDASAGFGTDNNWEYILRGELMLKGKRSEISDFTSFREDSPAMMLGGGVGYLDSDPTDPTTPDSSILNWSVDFTAEFGGSNLFLAVVGSTVDEAGASSVDRVGALLQGGVFISDQTELFARYTYGEEDGGQGLRLIETGLNHYIHGHDAKFTVDLGYSFNEVTTTWRSAGAGWRPDTTGEEGQFVLRTQLQILF